MYKQGKHWGFVHVMSKSYIRPTACSSEFRIITLSAYVKGSGLVRKLFGVDIVSLVRTEITKLQIGTK